MASSSRLPETVPSTSATPAPSSPPPPSESFLSELDGTAPSVLETTAGEFQWDSGTSGHGLNLVSWKKGVEEGDEGVDKRGFYAISTVLNHPTKKANPLRSTRKPLPPLGAAPPLPKPPPASHFDAYLKAVTPLYDTIVRSQTDTVSSEVLTGAFDKEIPRPVDIPPLDTVPDLFFERDFDLSDPAIWSRVVEAGPSRPRPTSVQGDLSSHLDTLERHLIHEITLRSTSFFSALSNLQDLHSESASCLRRISDLRSGLKQVGEKQARKGLSILDKMEDLRMLRETERGMDEMRELEEVIALAKNLVEGGDWAGGLACVGDVVRWWERHRPKEEDEPPDPIDQIGHLPLSTLPAFSALPLAVNDMTIQIALQLESALQSYLLSTLSAAELDTPYDKERFRDHVIPIVEGLVRCGAGDAVEGVWREIVTLAVREGSRKVRWFRPSESESKANQKHLPVAQTEDEGDEGVQEMRGANLAAALKSMDHTRYLSLTRSMYTSILARLRLAQTISPDLISILPSSADLPPLRIRISTSSPQDSAEPLKLSIDESDILASACELGNLRASKILAVRGEQHAGLGIEDFVQLFKGNWDFVLASEELAGRMIVSLRGVTASQARTFLIAYHSQRLTRSAKLVEEEQWNQIDVTPGMQHAVNIIIESAVSDPLECFIPPRQPLANGHKDGEAGMSKTLDVEEKKFFVVRATGESIGLLKEYLAVVVNLEVVVTDVMGRIIEFLKSFNSRTCQVVLGAGAMRSAGLKNITAKHLALASQSLSVIVALIPYIREFIRRHLGVKQAVMLTEFDKLKRDYQEHQNEIHAKLVAIMSDRLAIHVGSLRDIDWEAVPEKDGPRAYAELLVKETATLHKVLSKYLAISTVEAVMSEVLAAITHRLSEEFSRVELKSEEAKNRLLQDANLITARLTPLSEAGKTVSSLEVLVKDKTVPRKNMLGNLLKRGKKAGLPGQEVQDGQADTEIGEEGDEALGGEDEMDGEVADVPHHPQAEEIKGNGDVIPGDGQVNGEVVEKEEKTSEETPRESTESSATTASTAATSVPEVESIRSPIHGDVSLGPPGPDTSIASADSPIPAVPEKGASTLEPIDSSSASPPPTPAAKELPAISTSPISSAVPPPAVKSPPSTAHSTQSPIASIKSPPPFDPRSPTSLPALPASPSPTPSSSGISHRAPRVSLANRLKGVISRAGSVDREPEPLSPATPPADSPRRSIEGLRRSVEVERPVSKEVEGLPEKIEEAPPVPSKEESVGQANAETEPQQERAGDEQDTTVEIVSPTSARPVTELPLPPASADENPESSTRTNEAEDIGPFAPAEEVGKVEEAKADPDEPTIAVGAGHA